MAAHKIRAIGRNENGEEIIVLPETLVGQVKCPIPNGTDGDGNPSYTWIPLDDLINQYADEINENTSDISGLKLPIGTCSTSASTVAKVGTLANFELYNGATVALKFTYANTATNPTLDVNSTGAKAIYNSFSSAVITTGDIVTNMTAVFKYNGSEWMLLNPAKTQDSLKLGGIDASGYITTLENAELTGTPTAPTAAKETNNTQIATTAFVKSQGYLSSFASAALTGTPTAPTASKSTNSTQIATTAFVKSQGYLTSFASAALTGTPTAPTAAKATNSTQIATTAFVKSQGYLNEDSTINCGTF